MRWRQAFISEVVEALHQLGMKACPVCSTDALSVSPFPVLIIEGGLPPGKENLPSWENPYGDIAFAVRAECAACGYQMLFNSQKYRADNEKILELEAGEEHGSWPGDYG